MRIQPASDLLLSWRDSKGDMPGVYVVLVIFLIPGDAPKQQGRLVTGRFSRLISQALLGAP